MMSFLFVRRTLYAVSIFRCGPFGVFCSLRKDLKDIESRVAGLDLEIEEHEQILSVQVAKRIVVHLLSLLMCKGFCVRVCKYATVRGCQICVTASACVQWWVLVLHLWYSSTTVHPFSVVCVCARVRWRGSMSVGVVGVHALTSLCLRAYEPTYERVHICTL